MKKFFESFYDGSCIAMDVVALFYLDVAKSLRIFGKLFLHLLAGLLIVATTGVHVALIANYELVLKSGEAGLFIFFVLCWDYFVSLKVVALYKALDMLKAK